MAKDLDFTIKAAPAFRKRSREDEALQHLIDAWNSKNAKVAKRMSTFGFMAAALTACGGSGSNTAGTSNEEPSTGTPNEEPSTGTPNEEPSTGTPNEEPSTFRFLTGDSSNLVTQGLNVTLGSAKDDLLSVTDLIGSPDAAINASAGLVVPSGQTYIGDIWLFDTDSGGISASGDGSLWLLAPASGFDGNGEQIVKLDVDLNGGTLTFDLESDDLTVLIDEQSSVDLNGGTLRISDGNLAVSAATYASWNVGNLIVNSRLVIDLRNTTLSDDEIVKIVSQLDASTDSGNTESSLRLLIDDVEQAELVFNSLQANTGLNSGTAPKVEVENDAGDISIVDFEALIDSKIAFMAKSLERKIDALELDVTGDTASLDTDVTLKTLVDLSNTLAALQDATSGAGGLEERLAAAESKLAGIATTVVAEITSAVNGLKQQIEGEGFSNATLKSLAELSAAIETLRGDDLTEGSIEFAISEALGDEPTFDNATGRFVVQDLGDNQTVGNARAELMNMAFDYADGAVAALQSQVEGEGSWSEGDYQTLSELNAAVQSLETSLGEGSVTTQLDGLKTTLEGYADSAVSALETKLSGGLGEGDYATLKDLSDAVAALENIDTGAAGTAGTIAFRLAALKGELESYTDGEIAALKAALEGLGEGSWTEGDYQTLSELNAAVQSLETSLGEGSVTTQLDGLKTTLEGYADSAVSALETKLSGGLGEGDYATLKDLSDAVAALENIDTGAAGTAGTIAFRLAALKGELESYTDGEIAALKGQIDAIKDNSYGATAATLESIAGLKSAVEALQAANSGEGGVNSEFANLATQIQGLLDGVDLTAPEIVSITLSSTGAGSGGALNEGDIVTASVVFSEAVLVTGSPALQLDIGGTSVVANFAGGAGTDTLEFTYTIVSGDSDEDGISIPENALQMDGATIEDSAGNTAIVTSEAVVDDGLFIVDNEPVSLTLSAGALFGSAFNADNVIVGIGSISAQTVARYDGFLAGETIADDVLGQISGSDPADVSLTLTSPLTVAQANALFEYGFDVENMTYSIRDYDTTVQGALLNPVTAEILRGAELVTAIGDELDNEAMRFTSFDQRVNLRIEAQEGDDQIDAGRGDDQIVGGFGTDEIELTYRDSSNDQIIYQTIYEGETLPVTALTFSQNPDDYAEGSVLSVMVGEELFQYTTTAEDTIETALQGFATAIEASADVSGVNVTKSSIGMFALEVLGATPTTELTVSTDAGTVESPIADISNPGQKTSWSITFPDDPSAWPTQTNEGNTTVFERDLSVTIDSDTIRADVAYDINGAVDTAQSVRNLVNAINEWGSTAAEVRFAVENGDQSYTSLTATGAVTVNGITYDLPETASSLADLASAINDEFGQRLLARTGEIVVNTFTKGSQEKPDIIALSDGGFMVTYHGASQDPLADFADDGIEDLFFEAEVWAQRFDADGNKVGNEFQINARVEDDQDFPSVTQLNNGNLVFVWESQSGDSTPVPEGAAKDSPGDEMGEAAVARIFDMSTDTPSPIGGEFVVNQTTTYNQTKPHIAALSNDGFVVVWETFSGSSSEVFARVFDASGNEIVPEFQVNTVTEGGQGYPKVAGYKDGFIVAWEHADSANGNHLTITAFDNTGVKIGGDTTIMTGGSPEQIEMATLSNGKVAISWTADSEVASRGGARDPLFTIFDPNAPDAELVVTSVTEGQEEFFGFVHFERPSVSAISDGGFVVVFEDRSNTIGGSGNDVWARQFNADGTPRADAFQLNSTTVGDQDWPVSAGLLDGGFVVSWEGDGTPNEVYARIYNGPATRAADLVAIASIDPDTGELVIKTNARGADQSITFDGELFLLNGDAAIGGFAQTTETAAGTDNDSFTAAVSSSDQQVIEITGAALPATDSDAPTFTVDSAAVDQNGKQQQTTIEFSSNNADYYEGGTLSVEIAGQTITANMVAGDAAGSVAALVSKITNGDGLPAKISEDSGELTVDSTCTRPGDAFLGVNGEEWRPDLPTLDGDAVSGVSYAGYPIFDVGTRLGDLIDHFNAQFAGQATMRISDGTFVVETVNGGPDVYIGKTGTVSFSFYVEDVGAIDVYGSTQQGSYDANSVNSVVAAALESVELAPGELVTKTTAGFYTYSEPGNVANASIDLNVTGPFSIDSNFTHQIKIENRGTLFKIDESIRDQGLTTFETVDDFIASLSQNGHPDGPYLKDIIDISYDPSSGILYFEGNSDTPLVSADLNTVVESEAAPTGLILTAATEAPDPLSATGELTYAGEYQQATISLEDASSYGLGERAVDVYYEGGKAYVKITPIVDGVYGTPIVVSADVEPDAFTVVYETVDGTPLTGDMLADIPADPYVAVALTTQSLGMTSRIEFDASFTVNSLIEEFNNIASDTAWVSGARLVDGNIEVTIDKTALNDDKVGVAAYGPVSFGGKLLKVDDRVLNDNRSMWKYDTFDADVLNAQVLVDAIQAEIDGTVIPGKLDGIIGSVSQMGGTITLTAANPGKEYFEISDVRLDYQGAKQVATIALEEDTYSVSTIGVPLPSDREVDVYYREGKMFLSVNILDDAGNAIRSETIEASMADTFDNTSTAVSPQDVLTAAINAETLEGGKLYGVVESADYDSETGLITLTAAEFGKEMFEVSDVRLDYQGLKQIAKVDFTALNDSQFTPITYDDTGELSVTISATDANGNVTGSGIVISASMTDGDTDADTDPDEEGSLAALVDAIQAEIDGALSGIVSSVTQENGIITLTAVDDVKQQFTVTAATASDPAKAETTTVSFSADDTDYFLAGGDENGTPGRVSVTVDGLTYVVAMQDTAAATMQSLLAAIENGQADANSLGEGQVAHPDGTAVSALTGATVALEFTETPVGTPVFEGIRGTGGRAGGIVTRKYFADNISEKLVDYDSFAVRTDYYESYDVSINTSIASNGTVFYTSGKRYTDLADWAADAQAYFQENLESTFTISYDDTTDELVFDSAGSITEISNNIALVFQDTEVTDATLTFTGQAAGLANALNISADASNDAVKQVTEISFDTGFDDDNDDDVDFISSIGRYVSVTIAGQEFLIDGATRLELLQDLETQLKEAIANDTHGEGISAVLQLDGITIDESALSLTLTARYGGEDPLSVSLLTRAGYNPISEGNVAQKIQIGFTNSYLNGLVDTPATLRLELGNVEVDVVQAGDGIADIMTNIATALEADPLVASASVVDQRFIDIVAAAPGPNLLGTVASGAGNSLRLYEVVGDTLVEVTTGFFADETVVGAIILDDQSRETVGSATDVTIGKNVESNTSKVTVDTTQAAKDVSAEAVLFTNPNANSAYFGDAAQIGEVTEEGFNNLGVKQSYTNPDNDYWHLGDSAQYDPDGFGTGDATYYGDAAQIGEVTEGVFNNLGVKQTYTNPRDGYTAIDASPVFDDDDSGAGDETLFGSEPGYYDDDGLWTSYLSGGTQADLAQTDGEDALYVMGAGEEDLTAVIESDNTVSTGASSPTSDLSGEDIVNDRTGFEPFDWDEASSIVLTLGNDGADVIYNFQTGEGADVIAFEEDLAMSTLSGLLEGASSAEATDPIAFDLSRNEFGVVVSDDRTLLVDQLSVSDDVAALLNSVFEFGALQNGDLNTTIFAVTASDDDSVTAIWAHQQSSDQDSTIEASELYHLATVNTVGGEFSLDNFAGVEEILQAQIPV